MTTTLEKTVDLIRSAYSAALTDGADTEEACRCAIRSAAHVFDVHLKEGLNITKQDAMGLALSISVILERAKPKSPDDHIWDMANETLGQFYDAVRKMALN